MLNRLFLLALLAIAGLANAEYVRGTFYFQSGATVTAIGAIMWVTPTHLTGDVVTENWLFGNVTYQGTQPDYQTFIFDLDNKTIVCGFNTNNCFQNQTPVKRGWHSIRVYLRNSAGENWSDQRYIFVNISQSPSTIIITGDDDAAGYDYWMFALLAGIIIAVGLIYWKVKEDDSS